MKCINNFAHLLTVFASGYIAVVFFSYWVICGLLFGQFHVWWRHTTVMGWQTPRFVIFLCQILFITTPEQHWLHHQKTNAGFGDIFTFFDQPAKSGYAGYVYSDCIYAPGLFH